MKKYKVIDLYEGSEVLGYCDTLFEVKKLTLKQIYDTDCECAVYYMTLNEDTQKYSRASLTVAKV